MGKGIGVGKAALLLLPSIVYMTLAYALILFGIYALIQDHAVVNHACGRSYHIWKFSFLNLLLWVFSTVSYCVWNGGGEGARARALVLMIFYLAFFTWGILLWQALSDQCSDIMENQFQVLFWYHHSSTAMNGLTTFMFFVHEMYLGKSTGADYTIMPKMEHRMNSTFGARQDGNDHSGNGSTGSMMQSPGHEKLPQQISSEYEKIMQNNVQTASLPQTHP